RTTDPQQQFLTDPRPMIAAIQPRGELAILGTVTVDVRVEQQQRVASDRDLPDTRHDWAFARFDLDDQRFTIAKRRLNREQLAVDVEIVLVLPPLVIEPLAEISLVVIEADPDQRNAEVR